MYKVLSSRRVLKVLSLIVTIFYILIVFCNLKGSMSLAISILGVFIPIFAILIHGVLFIKGAKESSNCDGRNFDMNILSFWVMILLVTLCY